MIYAPFGDCDLNDYDEMTLFLASSKSSAFVRYEYRTSYFQRKHIFMNSVSFSLTVL
jgi:hypothetical protein